MPMATSSHRAATTATTATPVIGLPMSWTRPPIQRRLAPAMASRASDQQEWGRACNIAGWGGYMSGSVQVAPPPPPVPTGPTVTQVNSEVCRVTWNGSSGATNYDVSNMGYIIDTTPGTTLNWDAQCANPYAVRVCNAYTCSAWSADAYSY